MTQNTSTQQRQSSLKLELLGIHVPVYTYMPWGETAVIDLKATDKDRPGFISNSKV